MSRSKSKMFMYIKTDDFFTEDHSPRSSKKPDPERDEALLGLQEQIDDLTLFLEEEKLNHNNTKRQAEEDLQKTAEELKDQHEANIKKLQAEHAEEMEKTRQRHEKHLKDHTYMTEQNTARLRGEVEFLHGAFDSYKTQLHADTDAKWRKHESEVKRRHEEDVSKQLMELRHRMMAEKSVEKTELQKSHQKDLQQLRKDHRREIEGLFRQYADAADTVRKLIATEDKLQSLEKEFEGLKEQYDEVCLQQTQTVRELTQTTVQLVAYEKGFEDRVSDVESRFHNQVHSLMAQNTELRRQYMKKCGQLFEEQVGTEQARVEGIRTTKQAMRMLIESRSRVDVSLASGDVTIEDEPKLPKERPLSAPGTGAEISHAISTAGETHAYTDRRRRPHTCKPHLT